MPLLCGIDVGTTGLKAGIFDEDGRPLGVRAVEYAFRSPRPGFAEMDGPVYRRALAEALRDCCAQARCRARDIAALGVSSTGQAFLLVDEHGRELTPMVVWLDRRGDEFVGPIAERFDVGTYYDQTGIAVIVGLTTGPKLMWFARHEPELWARAARIVMIDAYVIAMLTGEFVGSTSIAAGGALWSTREQRWWDEMLELVGVAPERLNAVTPPATPAGRVCRRAVQEFGLAEGTLVAAGINDQYAGQLGAGNVRPGIVTESTGTAMAVTITSPHMPRHSGGPGLDPQWDRHPVPGLFCLMSFCNTSGILLKWLRDSVGFIESYDELAALAATSRPGSRGVCVCPHFEGTYYPSPVPADSGMIAGLNLGHKRADIVRAFFEAVAFTLRENVEYLMGGRPADRIRSLGGAAKSDFWLQIKADVTGCLIEKPVCQEAAILGDALMAGKAAGIYDSLQDAADRAVSVQRTYEPDPAVKGAYDAAFERYRDLIRRHCAGR